MNYVFFHGTKADPGINWFPWLKAELENKGHKVFIPALPTPQGQNRDNWLLAMKQQVLPLHDEMVLIGHSCGAAFIPHVLADMEKPIRLAVMVSPFYKEIGFEEYDALNESFFFEDFEPWVKKSEKIIIFHGKNDPYVPLEQAEHIADGASADLNIIKNGGHLNAECGYTEFPELLKTLQVEGVA